MTIARLAPMYRGRVVVPVLGRVQAGCTDRVAVRLVSGQSPPPSPHGPRARARLPRAPAGSAPPAGPVVLELVRRDALADPMPALPVPGGDRPAGAAGGAARGREPFTVRLQGTHLLIAGATGAGKGSYLWGLVRALLPAMAAGLVRVMGVTRS